ncbi:molybdopterin molybdotransferase MoeA [Entomobacter blattae]|uniref:Molybdopterin molybdenumtransferase n=1 Tax=Entomobacter blattae TaxID=2762277 RepID=A0A7H1NSE6_9PROT|nr:molybdopterin molybdotransferase MoeA [Entomobacter blattae]QNT78706.1 hypothetical protein JGUZn3_14830 [Entomobacter blattae]
MLSVAEARQKIFDLLTPVTTELIPITMAGQRITAQNIYANLTHPPAHTSSMDGYAIRYKDKDHYNHFEIVGSIPAGSIFSKTLQAGQCVRVFTGSFLSHECNCVIMQENAELSEDKKTVQFHEENSQSGQFIRPQGMDFKLHDLLIEKGELLTPRHIALAAGGNNPWIEVSVKPRVGILTSGNELAMPGAPLSAGHIINSNLPMIASLISAAGGEPVMLTPLQDKEEDLIALLKQQNRLDLLLTLGGASVGTYDLVKTALEKAGGHIEFWRIAMRPGKPLFAGNIGSVPVIGLPGNPVSAFVCSVLFVLPALSFITGQKSGLEPLIEQGVITVDWPANNTSFLLHIRSQLDISPQNGHLFTPFKNQDSSLMNVLKKSNALFLHYPHHAPIKAGSACSLIDLTRLHL